jgi:hypothetical protein
MLEAMPQDDVALLGLTPDARKGQVRISAEARNLEAMLQYHQRLEASDELSDVSLLNHEVLAAARAPGALHPHRHLGDRPCAPLNLSSLILQERLRVGPVGLAAVP